MIAAASALGVPDMMAPLEATRAAGPAQALKDFESLFIETLLQSSGLAQTFDTQGGAEGGMAGELLVRQLAQGLAEQLKLNFGRSLGLEGTP
jgi:Rod binding domain-containing protein